MSSYDAAPQNKLCDYYVRFDKANVSSPFSRNSYTMAPFSISVLAVKTKFKLLSEKKVNDLMALHKYY